MLTPVISPMKLSSASNPPPTESCSCPSTRTPPPRITWPIMISRKSINFIVKKLLAKGEVNHLIRVRLGDNSTTFTEPEVNNGFSIITQVIFRATTFSLIEGHKKLIYYM